MLYVYPIVSEVIMVNFEENLKMHKGGDYKQQIQFASPKLLLGMPSFFFPFYVVCEFLLIFYVYTVKCVRVSGISVCV